MCNECSYTNSLAVFDATFAVFSEIIQNHCLNSKAVNIPPARIFIALECSAPILPRPGRPKAETIYFHLAEGVDKSGAVGAEWMLHAYTHVGEDSFTASDENTRHRGSVLRLCREPYKKFIGDWAYPFNISSRGPPISKHIHELSSEVGSKWKLVKFDVLRTSVKFSPGSLCDAVVVRGSRGQHTVDAVVEVQKLAEKEAKEAEAASHKKETEADETHNKKTEADEDEPKSDDFSLERLLADVMDEGVQNDPELSDLIKQSLIDEGCPQTAPSELFICFAIPFFVGGGGMGWGLACEKSVDVKLGYMFFASIEWLLCPLVRGWKIKGSVCVGQNKSCRGP